MNTTEFKNEIKKAMEFNRALAIAERADELTQERIQDVSLMLDILNGSIFNRAVEQIEYEKQIGMRDSMYVLK